MAWTLARGSDQYLGCRSAQFLPQYGMGVLGRQEGGCREREWMRKRVPTEAGQCDGGGGLGNCPSQFFVAGMKH